jgi:predicted metal-dependent enzyme (double-stranded beta helix superfamily)
MTLAQQKPSVAQERRRAIDEALAEVRRIEAEQGISRESLEAIKAVLIDLSRRKDLFDEQDFPPPTREKPNVLYLLNEDPDGRFALYMSCGWPGKQTPPHDHTTWAVIVGLGGEEENRIYERTDDRSQPGKGNVRVVRTVVLKDGAGIAYMPDDIHSIHNLGTEPTRHFHLYGRSLEQLPNRVQYDTAQGTYKVFPASPNITRVPGLSA